MKNFFDWLLNSLVFGFHNKVLAGMPAGFELIMYFAESGGADAGAGNGGENKGGNVGQDENNGAGDLDSDNNNKSPLGSQEANNTDPFADFKPAEGINIDESRLKQFVTAAKEFGITPENLNKFMKRQLDFEAKQKAESNKRLESWRKANLQFLGSDKDSKVKSADIARALDAGGQELSKEVRQFFTDNGIDEHPALVKLFAAIGAKLADDKFVGGKGGGQGENASLGDAIKDYYAK